MKKRSAIFILVIMFIIGFIVLPAAALPTGIFELDGDAVDTDGDPGTLPDDWDSVFLGGSGFPLEAVFVNDTPPADVTYFHTGSTKDIYDISVWEHSATSAPDKNELMNAYAAAYVDEASGDLIIYFGADRYQRTGNAFLGFWFLQNTIGLNPDGTFSGSHAVGDILVLADFTNGGAVNYINAYKWVGTGGSVPKSGGTLDLVATGTDCLGATPNPNICATVNNACQLAPWPFTPKDTTFCPTTGEFPTGSFVEGGINVSVLFPDVCISTFIAESRSSSEINAMLKDFAMGPFELYNAKIEISPPTSTNAVDTNHNLTAHVEKMDSTTGYVYAPVSGAVVTFAIDSGPGSFVGGIDTCTTDGTGSCTVQITSDTAGTTVVSATTTVQACGVDVPVTTDGQGENSPPAEKDWVDAKITIDPDTDTNAIDEQHLLTACVYTTEDYSTWTPVSGQTIDFAIDSGPGSFVSGTDSCVTDVEGCCSVSITSPTAGTTVVSATATDIPADGGTITVSTDGTGYNDSPAEKDWVDGSIKWYKNDDTGLPLGGAIFEVCRICNYNSDTGQCDSIEPVCQLVTDNVSPDDDPLDGVFKLIDLVLGDYEIREHQAPPGWEGDLVTKVTVSLTLDNPDAEIAEAWVNRQPNEGCTPGYWKNHTACWHRCWENGNGDPWEDLVGDVFDVPAQISILADDTLMDALNYGGGPEIIDAAKILLRHAVAALLNACDPDIDYSISDPGDVISAVNTALEDGVAQQDRGVMLDLKDELDMYNNYGCPIDAHCDVIIDEVMILDLFSG